MKAIIIPLILTYSALSAQVMPQKQNRSKIHLLTGSSVSLQSILANHPEALISNGENVISHWMDFDHDGDYDLITVSTTATNPVCIFKNNNRQYDMAMKTVLDKMSIPELNIMIDMGFRVDVVWYDKNMDGYLDFYMSVEGSSYETEYLSNGDGTFQKLSETLAVN